MDPFDIAQALVKSIHDAEANDNAALANELRESLAEYAVERGFLVVPPDAEAHP